MTLVLHLSYALCNGSVPLHMQCNPNTDDSDSNKLPTPPFLMSLLYGPLVNMLKILTLTSTEGSNCHSQSSVYVFYCCPVHSSHHSMFWWTQASHAIKLMLKERPCILQHLLGMSTS